jgi:hypothetical protein
MKKCTVIPVDREISSCKKFSFIAENFQYYFIIGRVLIVPAGTAHFESILNAIHIFRAAIQCVWPIIEIASAIDRATEMDDKTCADENDNG